MMTSSTTTVCMFTNLYPPAVSGSAIHTYQLSQELAKRGCKVIVITAHLDDTSPKYEESNNVHVYRILAFKLPKMKLTFNFPWITYTFTPGNLLRIKKIIRENDPDVFHLHNHMFDIAFAAMVMRKLTHKPVVLTLHTNMIHSNKVFNFVLKLIDRLLLKHTVVNKADAVISPDSNTMSYLQKTFNISDSFLIPYGINVPVQPAEHEVGNLRRKYGLSGKKVIVSIGHVHEIRNRKDIIEALPHILKSYADTVLLIIGAVNTQTPHKIAQDLGIRHAIIFTGSVPHEEIPGYLALADIETHWLNQEVPEKTSLGIASLEAMGQGKVVIAAVNTDTYGKDILKPGVNFVLVEPDNPLKLAQTIIQLFEDDVTSKNIQQNAARTIRQHLDWDIICEKTLGVYQQVIKHIH
ncbi:glycosyltransferase family 4 protein [Candidatus Latescibacterota bacterium]